MFTFLLVVARTGSDLGVLWFPLWGPGRLTPKPLAAPPAGADGPRAGH